MTLLQKAQWCRRLVFLSLSALITVYVVKTLFILPPTKSAPNLVVCLLHVIPLIMFFPGMLANHNRSYLWLCFAVLLYFVMAVVHAFSETERAYGIIEVIFTTMLFISAMQYSRWYQRLASGEK